MNAKKLRVTLVRSVNKKLATHKDCVKGLGLRHLGSSFEVLDTPENRGMIDKVNYLLRVEEI